MGWRKLLVAFCFLASVPALSADRNLSAPVLSHRQPYSAPIWNIIPKRFDVTVGEGAEREYSVNFPECSMGAVQNYLTLLAGRLDRQANDGTEHRVRISASRWPNAFTLPNGTIYVTEGLLSLVATESELAAVMAHEVGHSVLRSYSSATTVFVAAFGLAWYLDPDFFLARNPWIRSQIVASISSALYGRRDEKRSDILGVYLAAKAGYDPYGMYHFFSRMQDFYSDSVGIQLPISHPSIRSRIRRALREAARISPNQGFFANSPEFEEMKSQVGKCEYSG